MADFRLETERLILRDWRTQDAEDFHVLGADPRVMEYLGGVFTREQTEALIADLQNRAARWGCTFWAVERKQDARVIGFTGLVRGTTPQIAGDLEIGWRLAHDCWGKAYAKEAAMASIDWAKEHCSDRKMVAITARTNAASRKLMERLGMYHVPERDFDHPKLDEGDPLRLHVVYEKELHK